MTLDASQAELAELAARHRTDKGRTDIPYPTRDGGVVYQGAKRHTDSYARLLAHLRDEPIRLLEIGVKQGASLRMWADFFPRATIVGIDLNPDCLRHAGGRVEVHIGDQSDTAFLHELASRRGPFDLVVDDGGHRMEQHRASLEALWPHVKPGGFYALEDMATSYESKYGGGHMLSTSTIERLKRQVDRMHGRGQPPWSVEGVGGIWFAMGLAVLCKAG
jgi:trans-aconitate methyltransferase